MELTVTSEDGGQHQVAGVVAFDRRISLYGPSPDSSATIGRIYIDWRAVRERWAQSRAAPHYMLDGDAFEEVQATVSPDGELQLAVAPQIFGHNPVLVGRMNDSTVTGTWLYFSHSDTLATGSFRMVLSRPSAATDSAITRSARAAKAYWSD